MSGLDALAQQCGVTRPQMADFIAGKRRPAAPISREIEQFTITGGQGRQPFELVSDRSSSVSPPESKEAQSRSRRRPNAADWERS